MRFLFDNRPSAIEDIDGIDLEHDRLEVSHRWVPRIERAKPLRPLSKGYLDLAQGEALSGNAS